MWFRDFSGRAIRGPALSIVLQASGLVIGLLTNMLLARWLSPVGYGIYGFAFGLVFVLSVPLHTGLATLVMRDAAHDIARQDHARLAGLIRGAPIFAVGCSLVVAAVLVTAVRLDPWGKLADYAVAIPVATLLLPGISLAAIFGSILRGAGKPLLGQLPDGLLRPLLFAMGLGLVWSLDVTPDSRTALVLHAIAAGATILVAMVLMAKLLPREVLSVTPDYAWRGRLSALGPLSLLAGIQAVSSFVATASLGLGHSPDVVGTYRLAELGGGLVAMPLSAVSAYAAGGFARTHALGDRERLQREASHAAWISLAVAVPVALFLFVAGEAAIGLAVGDAYRSAAAPMMILCVGQLASTMAGPAGAMATMCGHHRQAVMAVSLGLIVQIVLNVILVPTYGAIGAAIATAASVATWSHWLRWRVLHLTGVNTSLMYAMRGG